MSLRAGTRLGPYEIVSALGTGGMGEVDHARDTRLHRDVALKILPHAFAADADRLARFEREAQVLASPNHPDIAAIYGFEEGIDVGAGPPSPQASASRLGGALILELVEGPTLADRIARGPIPVDEALPIARQIAEALEAAHEHGIIHRDLKPANIKAHDAGTVKVLDFGLAKALAPEPGSATAVHRPQSPTITSPAAMTGAGMLLGTAAYMSPEQAKGRAADKRSDVWSFGCVLYEMLTGRRAFDGEDVTETIAAVVRDQPNWTLLPPDVPEQVRLLLKKCLEKDRRARVSDIAVARFLLAESIPWTAASTASLWSRRRLLAIAAVTALGVAMAAGGAWLGARFKSQTAPSPVRFVLAPPQEVPLFLQGLNRDIAISPDGSNIVYRSTTGSAGGSVFAVRGINDLRPRVLGGTGGRDPFMSPDGRWLGYFASGELRKMPMTGGPPIAIATLARPLRGVHWGVDDRIVFGVVDPSKGLQSIPASGGEPRSLTTPAREKGELGHYYPFTMPDGKAVLFTIGSSPTASDIAALDLETGRYKTLLRGGSAAVFVEPAYLVYASGGTLQAVRFDPRRLEVRGESVPIIDQVMNTSVGDANFSVSRNGTLVYVGGGGALVQNVFPRSLVWVDRRGIETPIKAPTRPYGVARLSPDGTRVAVDIRSPESDIWVWDLAHETLTPLNLHPAVDLAPVWTPDSRRIIWSSSRGGGNPNLYVQSADGTGPVERLTTNDFAQFATAVTPDGSRVILFSPNAVSGIGSLAAVDMFTAPIDARGQPPVPMLQSPAQKLAAEISPDGRWLAYQSDESGRHEVFVRPFPNVEAGRRQISTEGGTRPAWSRKGDELFYLNGNDQLSAVIFQASGATFMAGKPARVLNGKYVAGSTTRGYDLRSYDVSADGQRFLMLKETTGASSSAPLPTMTVVVNWIEELKARVPAK
jgi:eukaryotic-like serine/threonine-protein kinase